jgi:hypothetical protein|nr:MAG TPA: hypothetical protein [Caudoviricetes sp.]
MRLIDADKLKKDLESVTLSNGTLLNTNTVLLLLDKYPTTYDVDKVVEELEEIIYPQRLYFCRVSKGGCNKFDDVGCIDCAIQKAIEIVKRGGKNE